MSGQLHAPAGLPPKKDYFVPVVSQLMYENSVCTLHLAVCSVKTNGMALFRGIVTVCCGNCRKQLSDAFLAI
jgi:hypothetical protein